MEGVKDWIREDESFLAEAKERALGRQRYLFYKKGKGFTGLADLITGQKSTVYYGYCTHCHTESQLEQKPEHNGFYDCPSCGRRCISKSDGMGTKHLFDDGGYNFIRWHRGAIFIIHCYIAFDYRFDKYNPRITIEATQIWKIGPDGAESWRLGYGFNTEGNRWIPKLVRNKSIGKEKYSDEYTPITEDLLKGSWAENSRLTEFAERTAYFEINGVISYLTAYQKHPNIANLVNDRQYRFAKEYVIGSKATANRLIDWRKVRPHEMLRVQKEELPQLEALAEESMNAAIFYQKIRAAGQRLSERQLNTLRRSSCGLDERPMRDAIKRKRIPKALNYIERQYEADSGQHRHRYGTVCTWRDYLVECEMLGYDLLDDSIYYPPDLKKAHERTMKLVKIQEDEAARIAAKKRVDKLQWMAWEKDGFLIRPAASVNELKDEGKALSHCVGTYAQRYLRGDTAIFFIRRADKPNEPYFTLELDEKHMTVRQNRGNRNCASPKDVDEFVKRWLLWLPEAKEQLKKTKEKAE